MYEQWGLETLERINANDSIHWVLWGSDYIKKRVKSAKFWPKQDSESIN